MKIPKNPLFLAALLLGGCNAKKQANSPDTRCFQQVVGRDSTRLQLVLTDSLVTGFLALKPYEKDQAEGSITGTRTGDGVTANWQRTGEGVTQTHTLNLTLSGDTVRWREGERIEQGGKWVLKTPDAGFEYVLAKTNCQPE